MRTINISEKAADIHSFIVMDVLERAKELEKAGADIVHFEIGEPDFDTPDVVKKAGIAAIEAGKTKYTASLGLRELRNAIADHMRDTYGVTIQPEQALVTSGTSNALFLALAAIIDPGDEVIMSDPGYACYPNFVSFLGGKPVTVPLLESERWQFSPDRIAAKITHRTKAILVNAPANPTGMLLDDAVMEKIASLGPLVISDEIYHGMVYEGKARSMLEFTDHAIVIDGFSKRYAMTGWRLGHAIAPLPYLRPLQKMQQNFNISANSFVQWGGVAALREGASFVEEMRAVFALRRTAMIDGLRSIGFPVPTPPQGAFYVMVDARRYCADSLKLSSDILEEAHVAVTPGIDFGPGGEGYLRLSFATSVENIARGIERLGRFFTNRR
ncbi:MAG: pyridoxal phosphate-dependent aminotransferase [Nitrospinae bacterium]|nr:pyridoxal phosphate-dependent aminotransferase [Nitrospinota bacterium]